MVTSKNNAIIFNNIDELIKRYELLENKQTVLVNGCFDIFSLGHLNLLKTASEYGDFLVLALNSDNSIKQLKGNTRPIRNFDERSEILASIRYVDYVVKFEQTTVMEILYKLKPTYWVKGGDYNPNKVHQGEKEIADSNNTRIIYADTLCEPTTRLIERLKNNETIR